MNQLLQTHRNPIASRLALSHVLSVLGLVLFAAAGCADGAGPEPPIPPLVLEAISDTVLTGEVGRAVALTPKVRVRREDGGPAAGIPLVFVAGDGSTLEDVDAVSGADGIASAGRWTLGTQPGIHALTVKASKSTVVFRAHAAPGPLGFLLAAGGVEQVGDVNRVLAQPLRVRAADRYGNPLMGVPVRFSVVSGGGSIDSAITLTDTLGVASSGPWTLGPSAGPQVASASAGGLHVDFSVLACTSSCWENEFAFVDGDRLFLAPFHPGAAMPVRELPDTRGAQPAWAPDGQHLAFVRPEGVPPYGVTSAVWIVDVRGGPATRFMEGRDPSWSPDGRRLAMSRGNCLYECTSFVVDITDTTARVLLPPEAAHPAWSPDGTRIAYVGLSGDDGYHALYVVNADGSAPREVTTRDGGGIFRPSWSPDGTQLVFAKCLNGSCAALAARADGSDADSPRVVTTSGQVFDATWSPNGLWILLTVVDAGRFSLAFVPSSGGNPIPLVFSGRSTAWRPTPVQ